MYANLKNMAIKKRNKAIKNGIAPRFLAMADYHINKSLLYRKLAGLPPCKSSVDRAKSELLIAIEVFDAEITGKHITYETPLLDMLLREKSHINSKRVGD